MREEHFTEIPMIKLTLAALPLSAAPLRTTFCKERGSHEIILNYAGWVCIDCGTACRQRQPKRDTPRTTNTSRVTHTAPRRDVTRRRLSPLHNFLNKHVRAY